MLLLLSFLSNTMNKLKNLSLSLTLMVAGNIVLNAAVTPLTPGANPPPLAVGTPASKTTAAPNTQPKEVPSYITYNYYGEKYRDPFVPLIGESRSDQTSDRPPAIASLMLKGIVQDTNGRLAL